MLWANIRLQDFKINYIFRTEWWNSIFFACWYKFMKINSYLAFFLAFHGQKWVWLFWLLASKTGCISRMMQRNEAIFLHVDTNLRNLKNNPIVLGWTWSKMDMTFQVLAESQEWTDELWWFISKIAFKYYYLNDLINLNYLDFVKTVLDKKLLKIFLFIILDTKFQIVQNVCILFYEMYRYIKGFERSK